MDGTPLIRAAVPQISGAISIVLGACIATPARNPVFVSFSSRGLSVGMDSVDNADQRFAGYYSLAILTSVAGSLLFLGVDSSISPLFRTCLWCWTYVAYSSVNANDMPCWDIFS